MDATSDMAVIADGEKFTIISRTTKEFRRFRTRGTTFSVRIKPAPSDVNPVDHFKEGLEELVEVVTHAIPATDYIGMTIRNEENAMDKPVGLSFRLASQVHSDVIWNLLERVTQSNAAFGSGDLLTIRVDQISPPRGNGWVKTQGRDQSLLSHLKRSIVQVFTPVNCLAHALVIATAKFENVKMYTNYRKGQCKRRMEEEVRKIMEGAGVDLTEGGSIAELQRFQEYLKDYKIIVYGGLDFDNIYFEGESTGSKIIHLLYDDTSNHYDVIVNITGAMASRYYCQGCHRGFEDGSRHKCDRSCASCLSTPPCQLNREEKQDCVSCGRFFRNRACFENHSKNKIGSKTVCQAKQMCKVCLKYKDLKHVCFKSFCNICKKHQETGHACYMAPLSKIKKVRDKYLFVFYDFECHQTTEISEGTMQHVPNLICLQQFCNQCETEENTAIDCSQCGKRNHVFWQDPVRSFVHYLRQHRPWVEKVICLAHNSKAYDAQFVLNYMITLKWTPQVILDGTKILSIKVFHIVMLDSLSFLGMPLSEFSSAFDLTEVKGHYPYFFNTAENLNYVGPYPAPHYFGADTMVESDRVKFFQWYNSVKDGIFDNRQEILRYCESDVTILRKGCTKFRRLFLNLAGIDVFQEAITISSACNKLYRKMFLKPNTVAILPRNGYRMSDRQSNIGLQWLIHQERTRQISIVHTGNGREVHLPGFGRMKPDGYCEKTREVFEFLGCYFHGHTCLPNRDTPLSLNKKGSETAADRYAQTMARLKLFEESEYKLIYEWECNFRRYLDDNPCVKIELENHPSLRIRPISIRDCLYGGRTEAFTLNYDIKADGETIDYVDIISLYPYACRNFKTPIGHPINVYAGENMPPIKEVLQKEGIIKCKVLPPRNLYLPVLPFRTNGKLLFPLCRTCAQNQVNVSCSHTEEERAWIGTYVVDEVRLACEEGYRVEEVFEFWEYIITQYNPQTKEGGLFTEYINMFLQLKTEASGYPAWVKSSTDEDEYIARFYAKEGIRLAKENIKKNPGLRSLSKLCLNSFWGRFAMREDKLHTSLFEDPKEFFKIVSNPSIEVHKIFFPNDQMVWVSWKNKEEYAEQNPTVNVLLAAYVTTGARMRLYSFLKRAGRHCLYADTDSLIYVRPPNANFTIPTGDCLGDMSSELTAYSDLAHVVSFTSGGPKNYAYKVYIPETNSYKSVCKVRGITLNHTNDKLINFDTIRRMVMNTELPPIQITNHRKIKRKAGPIVVSEPETKHYQVVYNKRRRLDNNTSLPWGYSSD